MYYAKWGSGVYIILKRKIYECWVCLGFSFFTQSCRTILLKGDRILQNLFRNFWLNFIQNRINFRNLTWLDIIMRHSCTLRMPTPVASIPPPRKQHRFHPPFLTKRSLLSSKNTVPADIYVTIHSFTFTIKLVRPSPNHNI